VGTRNDDISLKLAKAVKQGFLPDVDDSEVDILEKEAKKLFTNDSALTSFNVRANVYNFKPEQLRTSRAALGKAKAGTGYFCAAFLGDSTVAGQGGTVGTTDWPTILRDMLISAGYPNTGGWIAAINGVTDSRVTKGAGWTTGITGSAQFSSNGSTSNPITFAIPAGYTGYRVYYIGGGGTDMTITTDTVGESVTPASGGGVAVFTKTGLSTAAHTVDIVRGSAAGFIIGVQYFNSTTGLRFLNFGLAGKKASDIVATTQTSMVSPLATVTFDSDLIFYMSAVNDAGAATTIPAYKASVQTGITNWLASGADVVLVTPAFSGFGDGTGLNAYTQALYELADENNIPLIDIQYRWGTDYTALQSDGLTSDVSHPSAAGYADIARSVMVGLGF
jgi:lysophospholipase L1-like esterase